MTTGKTKARLDAEIATALGSAKPTRAARGPRSSVRAVRGRQAAVRDYNRLVSERPEGARGDENAKWFTEGFEYVRRDVLAGWTPEEVFDLSTSVASAPGAFHDGADAARCLYNSRRNTMGARGEEVPKPPSIASAELAQAEKLARAYGVKLPS